MIKFDFPVERNKLISKANFLLISMEMRWREFL